MTTYPSPTLQVLLMQQQIQLATWATSGRPASPSAGWMGWNTTLSGLDIYDGSQWDTLTSINSFLGTSDLSVTATGSNQGTAYQIKAALTIVTGGAAGTGLVLGNVIGQSGRIRNATSNNLILYANGGGTVNGVASLTMPAGSTTFWEINASGVAYS